MSVLELQLWFCAIWLGSREESIIGNVRRARIPLPLCSKRTCSGRTFQMTGEREIPLDVWEIRALLLHSNTIKPLFKKSGSVTWARSQSCAEITIVFLPLPLARQRKTPPHTHSPSAWRLCQVPATTDLRPISRDVSVLDDPYTLYVFTQHVLSMSGLAAYTQHRVSRIIMLEQVLSIHLFVGLNNI